MILCRLGMIIGHVLSVEAKRTQALNINVVVGGIRNNGADL